VPVLNLLQNTMQDSWVGNHQTAITRIEKAKQRIAQRLQEEEKKKNEPLYRLQELFKKPELSPEQIAQARQLIQKLPTSTLQGDYFEKLQYKVPYFNQRDSEVSGHVGSGAYCNLGDYMCNMSSMAMGLALFGVSNPKPDMQYDDAVEKIRHEKYPSDDRTGYGQFRIAEFFGFYYGGLDGDKKNMTDNTWMFDARHQSSYDYTWYVKNILPELRKGNSITIGIQDKTNSNNGHIVHLLGVNQKGLTVHDPMGKANWEGKSYREVMYTNANDLKGEYSERGKRSFWAFERIKNSPIMKFNWIRVMKK
ncbi:MAG: C39 family peptidase, partial [Microscillaceae bacterium]|nr:C39 family peptidase [Microscillaceae bacterium]